MTNEIRSIETLFDIGLMGDQVSRGYNPDPEAGWPWHPWVPGLYGRWGPELTFAERKACISESCVLVHLRTGQFLECPSGVILTGTISRDGEVVGSFKGASESLPRSSAIAPVYLNGSVFGSFAWPVAECL